MCGYCKDCKFLRVYSEGSNSCKHFGNPWGRDLTDGDGCSQFYEPKENVAKNNIDKGLSF